MAFIVIYDANVLYPNTLRDLCPWSRPARSSAFHTARVPGLENQPTPAPTTWSAPALGIRSLFPALA
jgi:hypothetical protein